MIHREAESSADRSFDLPCACDRDLSHFETEIEAVL
jgi:hypothetical protein